MGEEGGLVTVTLKVDMDCNCKVCADKLKTTIGKVCADKLKTTVGGFDGVQDVKADSSNNKLTVVGKIHLGNIRKWIENIEKKTKKKVVLVSPLSVIKAAAVLVPRLPQKKADDKKPKVPVVSTVVLKIGCHCEGCIRKIKRIISETKGVKHVAVDPQKDLVTVKGTMDAKTLSENLKKHKRAVEIVQPKKDDGGGDRKGKGGGGGGGEKKYCKGISK